MFFSAESIICAINAKFVELSINFYLVLSYFSFLFGFSKYFIHKYYNKLPTLTQVHLVCLISPALLNSPDVLKACLYGHPKYAWLLLTIACRSKVLVS